MAQPPVPYSPSFPPQPGLPSDSSPHPDTETPPPPPPKPSSHEASRRGTPHTGAPWGPPAPPSSLAREISGPQGIGQHAEGAFSPANLPQPPSLEEGWIPDILKDKSSTDLQTILTNPTLLNAIANTHPSYTTAQSHLHSFLEANKALASHIQQLESHLASLRESTETLLLQHQSLEVSWRKKQTEMDEALAPWSPKALYQRLAAAVAEQEAVCQAVEESFLESEVQHGRASEKEVLDWVKRIRAGEAKLEARKEARARWDEGRVGGWR